MFSEVAEISRVAQRLGQVILIPNFTLPHAITYTNRGCCAIFAPLANTSSRTKRYLFEILNDAFQFFVSSMKVRKGRFNRSQVCLKLQNKNTNLIYFSVRQAEVITGESSLYLISLFHHF